MRMVSSLALYSDSKILIACGSFRGCQAAELPIDSLSHPVLLGCRRRLSPCLGTATARRAPLAAQGGHAAAAIPA